MDYRTCWACKHFDYSSNTPAYSDLTPGTPGSVRCAKSVFDYTNLDDLGQDEFRTLIETAQKCEKFEDREAGAST